MKILNLFAGIGGNRYLWDELGDFDITAIDSNKEIAIEYLKLFPNDEFLIGDAYMYLPNHYSEYDIIWASPPCQTHSKLSIANTRKRIKELPDFRLYSIISFLQSRFKGSWIVENVGPYYKLFTKPVKIDRHLFWSNTDLKNGFDSNRDFNFSKQTQKTHKEYLIKLEEYLGFKISKNIYLNGNHDPAQVYRNAVHPKLGKFILEQLV